MFSSNSNVFHRPRHEMIMFLRMFSTIVMAWLLFRGFCNSHHEKVRRHFRTLVSLAPEKSEHDPLQTVDFVWVTWRRPVCRRSQWRTWSQDDPKTGNSGWLECLDRMPCLDIVMSITSSSFHLNCPLGGWKSDWCWCGICLNMSVNVGRVWKEWHSWSFALELGMISWVLTIVSQNLCERDEPKCLLFEISNGENSNKKHQQQ